MTDFANGDMRRGRLTWTVPVMRSSIFGIPGGTVNSAARATPARTFSHGVTGFRPHRHGAEPQWSEGPLDPSELFLGVVPAGDDFSGLLINVLLGPFVAVIGFF